MGELPRSSVQEVVIGIFGRLVVQQSHLGNLRRGLLFGDDLLLCQPDELADLVLGIVVDVDISKQFSQLSLPSRRQFSDDPNPSSRSVPGSEKPSSPPGRPHQQPARCTTVQSWLVEVIDGTPSLNPVWRSKYASTLFDFQRTIAAARLIA